MWRMKARAASFCAVHATKGRTPSATRSLSSGGASRRPVGVVPLPDFAYASWGRNSAAASSSPLVDALWDGPGGVGPDARPRRRRPRCRDSPTRRCIRARAVLQSRANCATLGSKVRRRGRRRRCISAKSKGRTSSSSIRASSRCSPAMCGSSGCGPARAGRRARRGSPRGAISSGPTSPTTACCATSNRRARSRCFASPPTIRTETRSTIRGGSSPANT